MQPEQPVPSDSPPPAPSPTPTPIPAGEPQLGPITGTSAHGSKNMTMLFILIALLVLGAAGAAYWVLKPRSDTKTASSQSTTIKKINLASSQKPGSSKNRSSVNLAVGYVNYEPAKLVAVPDSAEPVAKLTTIQAPAADGAYSSVAFFQTNVNTYDQKLVMYDFGKKVTYQVDEETGLVRNFYNPVILSDHYVAFYLLTQKDPVTLQGTVIVVDLLTGTKTTLVDDTAGNLPWSSCCSVSPDGLHLAMPIPPNKLEIYNAGDKQVQTLTTTAKFVPVTTGQAQANDTYGNAVRGIGYPKIQWVSNDSILLARSASLSYTVNGGDTSVAPAKNGLSTLDLKTGDLTPVAGTDQYEITWFGVSSDQKLVFTSYTPGTGLESGPATGTVSLYVTDYKDPGTPQAVSGVSHEMLGSIVLDSPSNLLYLQDSASSPLNIVDLSNTSTIKTVNAQGSLIEGVYSPTILVGGNRDATLPSTQLNLLDLATDKLTIIY